MNRIDQFHLSDKIGPMFIPSQQAFSTVPNLVNPKIIAAGPLTKQPMTVAYRTVLVQAEQQIGEDTEAKFIVWTQNFPNYPDLSKSNFSRGDYFRQDSFADAVKSFGERIAKESDYAGSVLREDPA